MEHKNRSAGLKCRIFQETRILIRVSPRIYVKVIIFYFVYFWIFTDINMSFQLFK